MSLLRAFKDVVAPLGGVVVATDLSPMAPALQVADVAVTVPRIGDGEFVERLLQIVIEHRVRLLVPTLDPELPVLARARDRFAEVGCRVAVADAEAIDVCADKVTTHEWFVEHDIPTVRQGSPAEIVADPAAWPWPLIAKPAHGSASAGVRLVNGPDELLGCRDDDIVQTVASGVELTIDVYVDADGRARCSVPRQRIEVRAGEVSKAVTVRHAAAERLAERIAGLLEGAWGAVTVQLFADDDDLRVIEINPRFGGGYPLAWHAGARYPEWMVDEICGRTPEFGEWRDGLYMLRYDQELITDFDGAL